MDFLAVKDKTFLITGVANKKSVATFAAKLLLENGAKLIFSVQNEKNAEQVQILFPGSPCLICDVENEASIQALGETLIRDQIRLDGFLHSLAFANYSEGVKPFHETKWKDFAQATHISSFSLVLLAKALKPSLATEASVVTVSISNTRATSYGYMGPIKAGLDATVAFLAKSFSEDSKVRFNAVCSGPLKTSASAGIPDYIDNYLFAEQLTLRKKALDTYEVANTIGFLLSPKSSGINATGIVVDAGMSCNYFDQAVVKKVASETLKT